MIEAFSALEWVKHAFAGIRVCVCVLIFNAVVKLFAKAVTDKKTLCLYVLILAGAAGLNISPAVFVVVAGIAGIILKEITKS